MECITMPSGPSTANPQEPGCIIFRAGRYEARIPTNDDPVDAVWRYVLDLAFLGFRIDRVGNAIVITGRPSGMEGALS